MFDLTQVEENVGGSGKRLYIYPGVMRVVIEKWDNGESAQGTPYVSVTMVSTDAKKDNVENATREFKFYLTEASTKKQMEKILHIVTKVNKKENFRATSNVSDLVNLLNELTKGKELRMKFTGSQYLNQSGEVKDRPEIGLPRFAEAVKEGSDYPVVEDADTKLVYDANNQYDYKKLPADEVNSDTKPSSSVQDW
jgi:hypothetical protein